MPQQKLNVHNVCIYNATTKYNSTFDDLNFDNFVNHWTINRYKKGSEHGDAGEVQ